MSTSDNTTTSVLEVRDLHVEVANSDANAEPIQILKGVDLTVRSGETHAIMVPTLRQVDSVVRHRRSPQVPGHVRLHHPQR